MPSLRPKRSLGQHFLTDPNTARKIVNALQAPREGHVVEIGPGEGALTGLLIDRFPLFTAVEIDLRAASLLRERFEGIDVRCEDVLDLDWLALANVKGSPLYVIGNLPYNVTSQIIFGLIDAAEVVREAVVMMQLEVAERIVAEPRTKAYGILSVQLQLHSKAEILFNVSRNVFFPRPDVTSAVVRLTLKKSERGVDDPHPDFVRRVVRTAFNQRRKMLRNSLGALTSDRGIELPDDLQGRRAEELLPTEFVELARYLEPRV